MKRMSFSKTTRQVRERTKDVTRRLGWKNLKPGERFVAIEKGMGLKKGEKQVELAVLECVSNRSEMLCEITDDDVRREGFGLNVTRLEFISFFCKGMKATPSTIVQRIEFKYVEPVVFGDCPKDGRDWDGQCARCGSTMHWEDCPHCDEGFNGHDCGEDTCCCADPEENVRCNICDGKTGWRMCLSSAEFCEKNPLPGRETITRGTVEWFVVPASEVPC